MSVKGEDPYILAKELLDACQPSLLVWPEDTFPKFVAVLKKFVTTERLAEKMEDDFRKASMLWCFSAISKRLCLQARRQDFEKDVTRGNTCKITPTFNDHTHDYQLLTRLLPIAVNNTLYTDQNEHSKMQLV